MKMIKYWCAATALLFLSIPAYADLITFASRPTFNSAAPGLPVETFESGLVAPGGVTTCAGPLSSTSASACFPLGGLLPGVVYGASSGGTLAVLGAGTGGVGNTSKVLGPNAFVDTFNISFIVPTNAVGFDVFPGPLAGNVVISVFSSTSAPLGSFTIGGVTGGSFFGVLATTDQIGRINVASQAASPGELVDNLAFGAASVPEPSSLTLVVGGIAMLLGLRRKRT